MLTLVQAEGSACCGNHVPEGLPSNKGCGVSPVAWSWVVSHPLHRHGIVTEAPLVDQPTPFTCGLMVLLFLPLCRLFQVVLTDARNKKVFYRFQAICRGWVLRHRRAVAKERAIRQQGAVRVKLSACCSSCLAHGTSETLARYIPIANYDQLSPV